MLGIEVYVIHTMLTLKTFKMCCLLEVWGCYMIYSFVTNSTISFQLVLAIPCLFFPPLIADA